MINIKKTVKKPSTALRYMLDGLINQDKRNDFDINMSTFGWGGRDFCFGCAATCTAQEIAGINLDVNSITGHKSRAKALGFDYFEFTAFERCIDHARQGALYALFEFFDIEANIDEATTDYDYAIRLSTDNWKDQIPTIKKLIKDLDNDGY